MSAPRFRDYAIHPSDADELTGGRWINVRGIQRWQPDPSPARAVRAVPDVIACPRCNAGPTDSCRKPNGVAVSAHRVRTIPRCCPCGTTITPGRQHCDECRPRVRREQYRAYQAKRRAS